MIRLSVAVQHHPARAHLLPRLLPGLGQADVVTDPEPDAPLRSPLRTYLAALEQTPASATHRLVVQDDAIPCRDFRRRAEEAIAEHPDRIVCLWLGGQPRRAAIQAARAFSQGERFVDLIGSSWVPAVATCWPAGLVHPFVEFARAEHPKQRGDDPVIGAFCRHLRIVALAAVPSLVEHPDDTPSLIGRRARAGRDRGRVAAFYADAV